MILVLLLPAQLNVCSTKEHVPEIERSIRTVKERNRGNLHDLPFTIYPKILIVELILRCVSWLNAFPSENGISKELSPREIITASEPISKLNVKLNLALIAKYINTTTEQMMITPEALMPLRLAQQEIGREHTTF